MFVCVSLAEETPECMQVVGISPSDLTVPPEAELDIEDFILSDIIVNDEDNIANPDSAGNTEESNSNVLLDPLANPEEVLADLLEPDDSEQSALLLYAEAVFDLGGKITEAGENFGEAALAYRDDEITLEQFRNKFSSFKSKITGLIQDINALSPPSSAEQIHQKLTGGLSKCAQAISLMDEWFDTQDSGTRDATALLVSSCISQVNSAADELEELVN